MGVAHIRVMGSQRNPSATETVRLCVRSTHLEVADVPVAAAGVRRARDSYMHTIVGGLEGAPSMVLVPGYGAGAGTRPL